MTQSDDNPGGTSALPRASHRRAYVGTLLLLLTAAMAILYWQSFAWLAEEWSTTGSRFSHGFLLAGISAFLLIRAVWHLDISVVAPCWWALPLVFLLSAGWLLGFAANVVLVQTLVLPVLALITVCAALGHAVARQLAFAILYIAFALPAWEYLQFIFQGLTVAVASALLGWIGVPAIIDGNIVQLAAGTFRIASGCSGLTFIIVGLALGALYAHLFYTTAAARWRLIGVVFVASTAMNWVRVTALIVIGDRTAMQSSLVDDHHAFGWVLFAIMLVPLYRYARKLELLEPSIDNAETIVAAAPCYNARGATLASFVAVAVLAVGPTWAGVVTERNAVLDKLAVELPETVSGWSGPTPVVSEWQPIFHGASSEALALYTSADGAICLYSNLYQVDNQDSELIYVHNDVAGEFSKSRAEIASGEFGDPDSVNARTVYDGYSYWRIWYWYEIAGERETSEIKTKVRQAAANLRGNHRAGVFAIASRCDTDCVQASRRISQFMNIADPDLWLAKTARTSRETS